MFFRILVLGLLFFWAIKLVNSLLGSNKPRTEVRGKAKNKPLDLSDEDIEDIDFKETKDSNS